MNRKITAIQVSCLACEGKGHVLRTTYERTKSGDDMGLLSIESCHVCSGTGKRELLVFDLLPTEVNRFLPPNKETDETS